MKRMTEQFKALSCKHSTKDITPETPQETGLIESCNGKLIEISGMLIDSRPRKLMWLAAFHNAAKSVNLIIRAEKILVELTRCSKLTIRTDKLIVWYLKCS